MSQRLYHCWHEVKFEDTKGVIRSRKLKRDRKYNSQKKKDKQSSIKHYTHTQKLTDEEHASHLKPGWSQVLRNG